jgi:hypothetical protein
MLTYYAYSFVALMRHLEGAGGSWSRSLVQIRKHGGPMQVPNRP